MFHELRRRDDTGRFARRPLYNEAVDPLFELEDEPVFVGIVKPEGRKVMDRGNSLAAVPDWLLRERKMHQIGS